MPSFESGSLKRLIDLNQHLKLSDASPFWQKGVEILQDLTCARAVSLFLYSSHSSTPEVAIRKGKLSPACLARIQRWERALRTYSSEEFRVTDAEDVELGLGRQDEDRPIVHMRLRIEGILLGGISLIFSEQYMPKKGEYEALAKLAHLVLDGGLRARQLVITRHRLDQISLIAQVSQSLNSTLDLETVLRDTTEMSAATLQAEAATLFAIDERRNELIFYMPTGSAGGLLREMRIPQTQGVAGWVATNRESIIVNDVYSDSRFSSEVDEETGFETRTIVCVPLTAQGRLVGVLEVLNKQDEEGFTEEDKNWLEKMGSQAAIALENARLYQNLRNEQERIIHLQEEVRHQLARDLHDGPAQILSLIIMNVDVARSMLKRERYDTVRSELDLLEDLGRQANREIRTQLFELRPIILESRGLVPALHSYHGQLQSSMKADIHLEADDLPFQLTDKAANNIFSVVQEAINNIRKHAEANNVWIRLDCTEHALTFEVEDDGIGFNVRSVEDGYSEGGSFGLLNMHERLEMLDGRLSINSPCPRSGIGTLIKGKIPVSYITRQSGEK